MPFQQSRSNAMCDPQDVLTSAGFDGLAFAFSDSSNSSMRGPCPKCGGSRRLLVFIDHPVPNWNYRCDLCGFAGSKLNVPSDLYGTSFEGNINKPDYEHNLADLNQSTVWIDYHTNLTDENRAWLRGRGIPDTFQDQWVLGYTPSKAFLYEGQLLHSPAYTIPKISHDMKLVNMDYRLVDPPTGAGKYRSETGVPTAVFIASPGNTNQRRLFIVEGSFKAMVLYIFLAENGWGDTQVIGLPGVSSKLYREHATEYPEVYVMLDPDSPDTTKVVSRETGARPIYLPAKIDDAILGGMTWEAFMAVVLNSNL